VRKYILPLVFAFLISSISIPNDAFAGMVSVCHLPPDPNTIVTPASEGAFNGHLGHGDYVIGVTNNPGANPPTITEADCLTESPDPEPITSCEITQNQSVTLYLDAK